MSYEATPHSAQLIERLLADRIVLLPKVIAEKNAQYALAQLLFLMDRDSKQPISLYIDSFGGGVAPAVAIVDTIVESSTPVHTTCVGAATGTALLILACGTKGQRRALPHAQMRLAQLRYRSHGLEATDELKRLEDLIVTMLVDYSGQPEHKIRRDMEAERVFDAYEARECGLIDQVVMV